MARPKALLIGGAGATGTLIAEGLDRDGYEVTIFHRGVHEPEDIARFRHIHGDPHFAETTKAALGDETFDVVVAAYGRVEALASVFAKRCAKLVAVGGIPIHAGYLDPSSVRPSGMQLLAREDQRADPAFMARAGAARFAARMIAAEDSVLAHDAAGDYAGVIIRYPACYGPRSISPYDWSVLRRMQDGRRFVLLPLEGMGTITRCAAANAAHAVLLAVGCAAARGRAFNCGDDVQYSLRQWTELMLGHLGWEAEIVGLPRHLTWAAAHLLPLGGTTADHALTDTSAARDILGYRDVVTPVEALGQALDWRRANPLPADDSHSWSDPFDYVLEDEVKRRLDAFAAGFADISREPEAVHPYPHPKAPSAGRDERGR